MIGVPISTWQACTRCAYGRQHGTTCTHPRARQGAQMLYVPVDQVRGVRILCGPDGAWHEYAAPMESAA